ncbi:hypothetical protein V1525DRAFT_103107 [Lipomyces kononenkoae]|uniref:Uncharacterized protein n=1 Tax=Lipomyces kononenkoae TaxID=34357 RepID=A0ACC3SQR4_LIPKO
MVNCHGLRPSFSDVNFAGIDQFAKGTLKIMHENPLLRSENSWLRGAHRVVSNRHRAKKTVENQP